MRKLIFFGILLLCLSLASAVYYNDVAGSIVPDNETTEYTFSDCAIHYFNETYFLACLERFYPTTSYSTYQAVSFNNPYNWTSIGARYENATTGYANYHRIVDINNTPIVLAYSVGGSSTGVHSNGTFPYTSNTTDWTAFTSTGANYFGLSDEKGVKVNDSIYLFHSHNSDDAEILNMYNDGVWTSETVYSFASSLVRGSMTWINDTSNENGTIYVAHESSDSPYNTRISYRNAFSGSWTTYVLYSLSGNNLIKVFKASDGLHLLNINNSAYDDWHCSTANEYSCTSANNWTKTVTNITGSRSYIDAIHERENGEVLWFLSESVENYNVLKMYKYNGSWDNGTLLYDLSLTSANYIYHKSVTEDDKNNIMLIVSSNKKGIALLSFNLNDREQTNYTATFSNSTLEGTTQNYLLDLKEENISTSTATLVYNGTSYPTTAINSTRHSVNVTMPDLQNSSVLANFYWTYNITYDNESTKTENTSWHGQAIHRALLSFSAFTPELGVSGMLGGYGITLNVISKDENTNNLLNTSNAYTFNYRTGNNSTNLSLSETEDNRSILITPSWANITTDMIMIFGATNYTTRQYYLDNTTLNDITQNITLWLINTTNITNIYLTVKDENDNSLQDYVVKAMRYNVGNNTYSTVEMIKTNSNGQGVFQLIPYTVLYKFVIQKDGVTYLETSPTQITSSTLNLQVNLADDWMDGWRRTRSISYTPVSFDNVTQTFEFTYNDASNIVQTGCLEVIRRGTYKDEVLSNNCTSSTAGTLSYTVEGDMTGTYIATGYIDTNTGYSIHALDTLEVSYNQAWQIFGTLGVFMAFLVTLVAGLLGLANPVGAILMSVVGIIISVALGLVHITFVNVAILIIMAGLMMFKMRS